MKIIIIFFTFMGLIKTGVSQPNINYSINKDSIINYFDSNSDFIKKYKLLYNFDTVSNYIYIVVKDQTGSLNLLYLNDSLIKNFPFFYYTKNGKKRKIRLNKIKKIDDLIIWVEKTIVFDDIDYKGIIQVHMNDKTKTFLFNSVSSDSIPYILYMLRKNEW